MATSERKIKARAQVKVTVLIDLPDVWGGECPADQVYDQAAQAARTVLRGDICLGEYIKQGRIRLVDDAKVTMIVFEEERP
jgi:hypothetical protein